jgi:death on curing protein
MIPTKGVEQIHKLLIDTFGGSHGIRDLSALESALARPFKLLTAKSFIQLPLTKLLH